MAPPSARLKLRAAMFVFRSTFIVCVRRSYFLSPAWWCTEHNNANRLVLFDDHACIIRTALLYPRRILKPSLFEARYYTGYFYAGRIYQGLLLLLQVLHLFWTYFILSMCIRFVIMEIRVGILTDRDVSQHQSEREGSSPGQLHHPTACSAVSYDVAGAFVTSRTS